MALNDEVPVLNKDNKQLRLKTGQSFLEYAGIIALTALVLLMMHNYLNRGVQGKLKENLDSFNDEPWAGAAQNRAMLKTTSTFSYEGGAYEGSLSTSSSNRRDTMSFKGAK